MRRIVSCAGVLVASFLAASGGRVTAQGSDLDAFMREVLAKRDDNWKKLQQVRPRRARDDRFTRAGQGAALGRASRIHLVHSRGILRSQSRPLQRRHDWRGRSPQVRERIPRTPETPRSAARRSSGDGSAEPAASPDDLQIDGLLRQAREPEFVRAAYFLRFRFEEGRYALVGREAIDGREMLKIEHYPTNLFRGSDRRNGERSKRTARRVPNSAA